MLKVWIWKHGTKDTMCRVSPTEPEKAVRSGQSDYYRSHNDVMACSKYIRRITGRAPTLKPRVYWLTGQDEHGP